MAIKKIDDDFSILGRTKRLFASILLNDDDVRNLVMPKLDDEMSTIEENWFGNKELLGHCFNVPYIKKTITDSRNLITMESTISAIDSGTIKEFAVDLFVFCHRDTIDMDYEEKSKYESKGYNGNRVDMIIQAVYNAIKHYQFDNEQDFGIGDLRLIPNRPIKIYIPDERFYGKQLTYTCKDFYMKSSR